MRRKTYKVERGSVRVGNEVLGVGSIFQHRFDSEALELRLIQKGVIVEITGEEEEAEETKSAATPAPENKSRRRRTKSQEIVADEEQPSEDD